MFTNLVSDGNVVCDLLQYFTLLQCFVPRANIVRVRNILCQQLGWDVDLCLKLPLETFELIL